jgi:hypothetical protein
MKQLIPPFVRLTYKTDPLRKIFPTTLSSCSPDAAALAQIGQTRTGGQQARHGQRDANNSGCKQFHDISPIQERLSQHSQMPGMPMSWNRTVYIPGWVLFYSRRSI